MRVGAVESVHINAYAASAAGSSRSPPACFVMLSPMTHDPVVLARLLTDRTLLRAAVVFDFIPRHRPDLYLPSVEHRLAYALALRWLARCDLFAPISRTSADELKALFGAPESAVTVTGAPVHGQFETVPAMARGAVPRHLLVAASCDPRKNAEVAIRAHARSAMMQAGSGIPLVVAGTYEPQAAEALRALAASPAAERTWSKSRDT
jgi:hypothetical protein